MGKFSIPSVLCFLVLQIAMAGQANAALISWTANGGPSDFDNGATITFAPLFANQITTISGGGYYHSHSSAIPTTATIQLHLNGTWTSIFTTPPTTTGSQTLSNTLSTYDPITFAAGNVDGLRFLTNFSHGNTFHGFTGETFDFALVNAVPEPSSIALFSLGAIGMGFVAARRRREKKPAA